MAKYGIERQEGTSLYHVIDNEHECRASPVAMPKHDAENWAEVLNEEHQRDKSVSIVGGKGISDE